MNNKGIVILPIVVIVAGVLAFGAAGYFFYSTLKTTNENTNSTATCTLDAKLCPDGSSVGRTGPNCEFAACPSTNSNANSNVNAVSDATKGWKTYTNNNYKFTLKYPSDWSLVEGTYDGNPLSSDYVLVKHPTNADLSFMVCPDERGGDCMPFQDAQWDSATTNVTVDGKAGVKTSYTSASGRTCPTCTPRSTITLSERPTGWAGGRDFLLRPGADNSTLPDTILSTFTFTQH